MLTRRLQVYMYLALFLANLIVWTPYHPDVALAGRPLVWPNSGTCWLQGYPTTCVATWSSIGPGKPLLIRLIDQFSSTNPEFRIPAEAARNSWTSNTNGPQ